MPEFTRTRQAAQIDRTSKWDLIAAIAEDAASSAIPITSAESQVAAKAAMEVAGCEYASRTIEALCIVAKFDHEATSEQRATWRQYGWTVAQQFADAGWSQEAAAHWYATTSRCSRSAAVAAIREAAGGSEPKPTPLIDDAWRAWLNSINRVLTEGARLAERSESEAVELGAHSAIAKLIYERITERKLDAEIRELFESVEADA